MADIDDEIKPKDESGPESARPEQGLRFRNPLNAAVGAVLVGAGLLPWFFVREGCAFYNQKTVPTNVGSGIGAVDGDRLRHNTNVYLTGRPELELELKRVDEYRSAGCVASEKREFYYYTLAGTKRRIILRSGFSLRQEDTGKPGDDIGYSGRLYRFRKLPKAFGAYNSHVRKTSGKAIPKDAFLLMVDVYPRDASAAMFVVVGGLLVALVGMVLVALGLRRRIDLPPDREPTF